MSGHDRATVAPGWGLLLPLAALGAAFYLPLAIVAMEAAGSPTPFLALLRSEAVVRALINTVVIALSATTLSLLAALAFSIPAAFAPFPGIGLATRVIDLFVTLPTFLVALAFTFLYGSAGAVTQALRALAPGGGFAFLYSRWGVILAEVTVYTPFALRPLLAALERFDRSQIDVAASLGASAPRILSRVIVPALLPALAAGGSLCLLLTMNEFGIVLFIGAKGVVTLPVLIFDRAVQEFDYGSAAVIAMLDTLLSFAICLLYRRGAAWLEGGRGAVL